MATTIEYEIKTNADLKAFRETAASLRQQIVATQAAGKDAKALKEQLDQVTGSLSKVGTMRRTGFALEGLTANIPILGQFVAGLNGLGGPIALATTAATALVGTLTAATRAFSGAQDKMAKMDAVLANAGTLTDAYREQLQDLAGTLQDATAIADDDWLGVLAKLSQFGADSSNIEQYSDAVKNLAGIIGGDITTAGDLMARAIQGNFEMLGRYGINVEKSGTQTERLDSLMAQLATRGGGVLEAQGKTLSGQWRQLALALDDLMEGIGNLIARTGILQATMGLLTGTLKVLQSIFPSLIPATEGLQNKFRTIAQRSEEVRAKLDAQKAPVVQLAEVYGEAGRALDELNARLDTAAQKSTVARQAALDLADANAEAAKAAIDRAEAEGVISPEAAASKRTVIERRLSAERLAASKAEQQQILDNARAQIATTAQTAANAQAAQDKAAAEAAAAARTAAHSLQAAIGPANIKDWNFRPESGDFGTAAIRAAIVAQEEGMGRADDNTKNALAAAEAAEKAFAAQAAAAEAAAKATRLAAETTAAQQPKVAAAESALHALNVRAAAAKDTDAAQDAAAKAADAQAAQDKAAADAKSADARALLELEIQIANARARGDETAATAAQRRLDYLKSYQNIWEKTGDADLAERYATATASPLEKASTAAARPNADRLAQIGGYVGGMGRADRTAEDTAKATRDTAKNTERIARAISTPPQKGELTF